MKKLNTFILQHLLPVKILVWVLSLLPAAWIAYGIIEQDLGANPVQYLTNFTGKTGITFLCITLAITPLRRLTGLNALIRLRRTLGNFCFFYILAHFFVWFGIDHSFDTSQLLDDISKRPYITVGFAAFFLLTLMAATSFRKAISYLGRRWQTLHYSIYVVAVLATLHYYWIKAAKHNFGEVYLYGGILAILLAFRLIYYITTKIRDKKAP